jgi:CheY-like chemotaxis protein
MIFIVDDDRSVRSSLSRLMRSAGYEALAFATAEEYLDAVIGGGAAVTDDANEDDDCVILDLHMSGMNGLELQQILNRYEPPVPVIVLSATEDSALRAKALAAGAAKVLRKPCDSGVLLRAVADAIGNAPSPSPPAYRPTGTTTIPTGQFGIVRAGSDDPDPAHFVLEQGHATYRPIGFVTFDEVVAMVRDAIAAARRKRVGDLLVDTTALTGFPSPDTFERFLAAV